MLKNGQTYFKNLAAFKPQDYSIFGHFSTCMKRLILKSDKNKLLTVVNKKESLFQNSVKYSIKFSFSIYFKLFMSSCLTDLHGWNTGHRRRI